jgi:hypothetical protein
MRSYLRLRLRLHREEILNKDLFDFWFTEAEIVGGIDVVGLGPRPVSIGTGLDQRTDHSPDLVGYISPPPLLSIDVELEDVALDGQLLIQRACAGAAPCPFLPRDRYGESSLGLIDRQQAAHDRAG